MGDPYGGTKPAYHVGEGARKGRPLAYTTIKAIYARSKWCIRVDFDV